MNDEFYHVVQRGVEKRVIFHDDEDHLRMLHSFLVFNDAKEAPWTLRHFWNVASGTTPFQGYVPEKPLVEIHAFVLMHNHFHLLLRQFVEQGISKFMKKLGGYVSYFNKKYQRVGPLFQGRFRAKLIKTEDQLKNTFVYIHTNPVEIIEPKWKDFQVDNVARALSFLHDYQWSSYPDFIKTRDEQWKIQKDFFLQLLGGSDGCRQEINGWIRGKNPSASEVISEWVVE